MRLSLRPKNDGKGWIRATAILALLIAAFTAGSFNKKISQEQEDPVVYIGDAYQPEPPLYFYAPSSREIIHLANEIAQVNPKLDSKKLKPGMIVLIPDPDGGKALHAVTRNDTGYIDIARKFLWNRAVRMASAEL